MPLESPRVKTIKRLFAVAGNNCAFPKCPLPLVDESGKVTGRICHIKARSDGGARYDANQNDEERHGFENLILMCPIHHDVIDSDEISYTAERLISLKSEHENNFQNGIEPDDQTANLLILNSQSFDNSFISSSVNQSGGQTANQINNFLQNPETADSWERHILEKRYKHDLEIFSKMDAILTEEHLNGFLDRLFGSHKYLDSGFMPLEEFQYFSNKQANKFLTTEINSALEELLANLSALMHFVAIEFFIYPENQTSEDTRFCLQPSISPDRGYLHDDESWKHYAELTEQLNKFIENVMNSYTKFRRTVKEQLAV